MAKAKSKKTKKTPKKTAKKKVPVAAKKVQVLHLHCSNCGEDDEKIVYCAQCDSPMDFVKVEEKAESEVSSDSTVDKVTSDSSTKAKNVVEAGGEESLPEDPEMDKLIEEGLTDIFPSGGAGDSDSDAEPMDMESIASILDEE